MNQLKLAALDADDLVIVSAHVQDAVVKPIEITYDGRSHTLIVPLRRYVWEKKRRFLSRGERRLAALSIARISSLRSTGIDRNADDAVLNLLALRFAPAAGEGDPSGTIELMFSGGAAIAADVECIELRLADLGAAWQTESRPAHGL